MVVVLIGKLQLESVGKDIALASLCAFKQVSIRPKNQRLSRHCGWGGEREREMADIARLSDLKSSQRKRVGGGHVDEKKNLSKAWLLLNEGTARAACLCVTLWDCRSEMRSTGAEKRRISIQRRQIPIKAWPISTHDYRLNPHGRTGSQFNIQ